MQIFHTRTTSPAGEIISNLFHATVAVGFGLLTLASALHVAMALS